MASHIPAGVLPWKETQTLLLFGSLAAFASSPSSQSSAFNLFSDFWFEEGNVAIARAAVVPGSVAVTYAHRSVRTKACHSVMAQEL